VIHCEQDLLANLIELSPKNARHKFRQCIFEAWDWKCAYCDKELNKDTATIDHILPKFKGGHNVKSNMICSCSKCNRLKGSNHLEDWYNPTYKFYQEERLGKIKYWMEQSSSIKILSSDKATPYITNDFDIGWVAS
jgi:CRISPR/Cas system Type II protein with McrA/HNH and RuvC-like nuclease domain